MSLDRQQISGRGEEMQGMQGRTTCACRLPPRDVG